MEKIMTNRSEAEDHRQAQCQTYFDLIEGGVCFVLADDTERIVFANEKVASLYECKDAEDFLQFFLQAGGI